MVLGVPRERGEKSRKPKEIISDQTHNSNAGAEQEMEPISEYFGDQTGGAWKDPLAQLEAEEREGTKKKESVLCATGYELAARLK